MYREQYGEYAYWCLGVYNTGSKGWELIWHRAIPALDKMCLCFFFFFSSLLVCSLWLTGVKLPWWDPELMPIIQCASSSDRQ